MNNNEEELTHTAAGSQWQRTGVRPHQGIALPLFSLHSAHSCGIGEYPDLIPLIRWCSDLKFDVLQLLPLNDTGLESSPYSALSAIAFNPLHIGLSQLPYLNESPELLGQIPAMQQLTATQRVDYAKVRGAKERFLQEYYRSFGKRFESTTEYQSFINQNKSWLEGYSLFKAIKTARHWQTWELWDAPLRNLTTETYLNLQKECSADIAYHSFLQYLCHQQITKVKQEAEACGVFLKGDIPILINRDSADVWLNRSLFFLEYSAGAPPDMYAEEGQNWGFPIYDWKTLEEEDYAWWKRRLHIAEQFYHIYRLDHIVGFFRIWSIPKGATTKEGHYIPEDSNRWIDQGDKVLQVLLHSSSMLPIGEDLGNVPPIVRVHLSQLGICGTKVIRWERNWNGDKRFIPFQDYSPRSMTTVSTHDSETLQQWWENHPAEARDFAGFMGWDYTFEWTKAHQKEMLKVSHRTNSLFHINLLQEYLSVIPGISWPNPDDERINVPGVVSDHNWTYRYRPSVEEIVSSQPLAELMREILQ